MKTDAEPLDSKAGIDDNAGVFLGPILAPFPSIACMLICGGHSRIFYVALIPGLLAFLMVLS